MNETFIFNSIRNYNKATRQTQRNVILYHVGVYAGLIERQRSYIPELSQEERQRVLYFLNQFLKSQDLKIKLKD